MNDHMTLAELEKEVTRLEDIQAIEDLERIYGYYFDTQQMDRVVDLFSDNAVSVEIESHGQFLGKEGVKRMYLGGAGGRGREFANPTPRQVERMRHRPAGTNTIVQLCGVVTLAEDGLNAKGRWHSWLAETFPFAGKMGQYWLHGYYENEFVKENGQWLFSKLFWNTSFYTRFETGWQVQPIVGFLPMPKSDNPPTAFYPYPSQYHFHFSFRHPVTGEPDEAEQVYHHPMAI